MSTADLQPMGIAGVAQHGPDMTRYTQTHMAAFSVEGLTELEVVAWGFRRDAMDFCADPACADYKRNDFPKDRPHYHVGKKVVAPVTVTWAESDTKAGKT